MRNVKKMMDSLSGKEINHFRITTREPFSELRQRLIFSTKIESAHLTEVLTIKLKIFNRTINGEVDEAEFDWVFSKFSVQEDFIEMFYELYNLEIFGINRGDLEMKYEFV